MDKKKYFRDLITLFEATGMTGAEEVIPQEEIADSGSDVNPGMEGNIESGPDTQVQPQEMDSGMEDEIPVSNNANIQNIMLGQKLLKMYSLYEDLLKYCNVLLDSLANLDVNRLDLETFKIVRRYNTTVRELVDKINNYMINIYSNEDYERLLYVYVLFRTELTTCVKGIRDILNLNKLDEEIK